MHRTNSTILDSAGCPIPHWGPAYGPAKPKAQIAMRTTNPDSRPEPARPHAPPLRHRPPPGPAVTAPPRPHGIRIRPPIILRCALRVWSPAAPERTCPSPTALAPSKGPRSSIKAAHALALPGLFCTELVLRAQCPCTLLAHKLTSVAQNAERLLALYWRHRLLRSSKC